MDRHICRAKRKGNSQWIQGYIVKCDGNINHGRMFIIPEVTSILYTPNNITLGERSYSPLFVFHTTHITYM